MHAHDLVTKIVYLIKPPPHTLNLNFHLLIKFVKFWILAYNLNFVTIIVRPDRNDELVIKPINHTASQNFVNKIEETN